MTRLIAYTIVALLSFSYAGFCRTEHTYKYELSQTDTTITSISIDKKTTVSASFLKQWLRNEYLHMEVDLDISKDKTPKSGFDIYNIKLKGELPNNIKREYTFIHQLQTNSLFLIPFEFNQYYAVDGVQMFGGFYNNREYDYYLVFKFEGNAIRLIFDTRTIGSYGLKVSYYKDDECLDYQPDRLHFRFDKQKKTIQFYGNIAQYCSDRRDRDVKRKTPLSIKKVTINIDYSKGSWQLNKNSTYVFW